MVFSTMVRAKGSQGGQLEQETRSWKGAAVQTGLEPGSRGIAIVRSRYQATTSEDTVAWKRQRDFAKCVNCDSGIVICSYNL
jgi:hypothetical protein